MLPPSTFDAFLRAHTRIASPAICPEVRLHLGDEFATTWEQLASALPQRGVVPPYWSVAWVGGQALARYTLDNAAHFRRRTVLDFGAGSGLCGIAAATIGAAVEASDIDPSSLDVIAVNARLNGVAVGPLAGDLIGCESRWNVVLAGDVWYDGHLARRLNEWLTRIARSGTEVLLGDCGRAHFPRRRIAELQRYEIPASESLERHSIADTGVWRLG